ncbi:GNAT family N-acetyltransferase [Bacillus sp. JJ1122]|uniref:GNAT family N-acetyltransferase n=1 Tax=Bacillus sp. JJ1122 TaxID=3122951 RepID=UPI0030003695
MEIRSYATADAPAILKLFRETILSVNHGDYTQEQCEIWANSFSSIESLDSRLRNSFAVTAEVDWVVAGFGNLNSQREIDLLYTHKNYQARGIGSAILRKLESVACLKGYEELTTEASITALDFFLSKGYVEVKMQNKRVGGIEFINFIMKKTCDEHRSNT